MTINEDLPTIKHQKTYGDVLAPLNVDDLFTNFGAVSKNDPIRTDPAVLGFLSLLDKVSRAEKISDPADWTVAESAAYERGDSVEFSRLRGYTEEEICDFKQHIRLAEKVDANHGEDTAISLLFSYNMVTKQKESPVKKSSLRP